MQFLSMTSGPTTNKIHINPRFMASGNACPPLMTPAAPHVSPSRSPNQQRPLGESSIWSHIHLGCVLLLREQHKFSFIALLHSTCVMFLFENVFRCLSLRSQLSSASGNFARGDEPRHDFASVTSRWIRPSPVPSRGPTHGPSNEQSATLLYSATARWGEV